MILKWIYFIVLIIVKWVSESKESSFWAYWFAWLWVWKSPNINKTMEDGIFRLQTMKLITSSDKVYQAWMELSWWKQKLRLFQEQTTFTLTEEETLSGKCKCFNSHGPTPDKWIKLWGAMWLRTTDKKSKKLWPLIKSQEISSKLQEILSFDLITEFSNCSFIILMSWDCIKVSDYNMTKINEVNNWNEHKCIPDQHYGCNLKLWWSGSLCSKKLSYSLPPRSWRDLLSSFSGIYILIVYSCLVDLCLKSH